MLNRSELNYGSNWPAGLISPNKFPNISPFVLLAATHVFEKHKLAGRRRIRHHRSGRGPAGSGGRFVAVCSQVGRPLRPLSRGTAAGGAILLAKNKRQIDPRTDPGRTGGGVFSKTANCLANLSVCDPPGCLGTTVPTTKTS